MARVVDQIVTLVGRPEAAEVVDIAVDFSHRQREWNFLDSSLERLVPRVTRVERGIQEQPELLEASRVLIVPPPYHTRLTGSEVDRLADWVDGGGGLFMMGCYDERHHASNFSELAWRFDFDFRQDVLVPQQAYARTQVFSRDPKHAVLAKVDPGHPIANGVNELAFLSAASIVSTSMEDPELVVRSPETTWTMRPIGHIQPDGSRPAIDTWEPERQGAAVVLAARTWNKGRVVVCGTWKLWTVNHPGNGKVISNILGWLSGSRP